MNFKYLLLGIILTSVVYAAADEFVDVVPETVGFEDPSVDVPEDTSEVTEPETENTELLSGVLKIVKSAIRRIESLLSGDEEAPVESENSSSTSKRDRKRRKKEPTVETETEADTEAEPEAETDDDTEVDGEVDEE